MTYPAPNRFVKAFPTPRSSDEFEQSDAQVIPLPLRRAHAGYDVRERRASAELKILGGFRLVLDGELVEVSMTGQRLVVAVAAIRAGPALRAQVAHVLWPDSTSARAHSNLRTGLYRLQLSCPGLVEATCSYLRLLPGLQIDFDQSRDLATRILSDEGPLDAVLLEDALYANLYEDLLPDWDEAWLGDQQSRFRQLRLASLEMLSHRLTAGGRHGAAVHTALAAVHADSLRDSAHETLIRACLAHGNRHEALTHYASYQRIFRDELGVEPAASIRQLLQIG